MKEGLIDNGLQEQGEVEQSESYQPFDPEEELKDIRKFSSDEDARLSKEEKREIVHQRIGEFKEKLDHQRLGIAEIIGSLWQTIHKNPDISAAGLFAIIEQSAPQYKLTDYQMSVFGRAIDGYIKKHEAVEEYTRGGYFDSDEDLFKACFGFEPEGKIGLEKEPMMLYWRCMNKKDFARAAFYGDFDKAKSVVGVAMTSGVEIKHLNGAVALENTSGLLVIAQELNTYGFGKISDWYKEGIESIKKHEEQHLWNGLIRPAEEIMTECELVANIGAGKEANEKRLYHELIRLARKRLIDPHARDEIIALYRDGSSPAGIYNVLTSNPLYDYLSFFRRDIDDLPLQTIDFLQKNFIGYSSTPAQDKALPELKSLTEIVFGEEYHSDLKKWTEAITNMEKKGYSREEIINLIFQEPANHWSNLARQLAPKRPQKTLPK